MLSFWLLCKGIWFFFLFCCCFYLNGFSDSYYFTGFGVFLLECVLCVWWFLLVFFFYVCCVICIFATVVFLCLLNLPCFGRSYFAVFYFLSFSAFAIFGKWFFSVADFVAVAAVSDSSIFVSFWFVNSFSVFCRCARTFFNFFVCLFFAVIAYFSVFWGHDFSVFSYIFVVWWYLFFFLRCIFYFFTVLWKEASTAVTDNANAYDFFGHSGFNSIADFSVCLFPVFDDFGVFLSWWYICVFFFCIF